MKTNGTENPKFNLFHWLIILLGIIPPHSMMVGNKNGIFQRFYKLYAVFVVFIVTVTATISLICHIRLFRSDIPNFTLLVTDSAFEITATITTIVTILAPTILYSSSLNALFENYRRMCRSNFVDEIFKITTSKRFVITVIISHIILSILFVFDGHVWITGYGLALYSLFILRKIQTYHSFITILTIYVFVKFIKTQLEITNNYLIDKIESRGINGRKRNLAVKVLTKFDNDKICFEIRQVTQSYENHVRQVTLFNKVFGTQLLFLTLTFIVGFLNSINLVIFFGFTNFQIDMRTELILMHLLWTLWQLVIGSFAVVKCTETEEVGRITGDISLNALTNLPFSSENKRLKEELFLLNRLVNQKSPIFSAAGFFPINYSLLLGIIGSITSYIIVLIQFNKV